MPNAPKSQVREHFSRLDIHELSVPEALQRLVYDMIHDAEGGRFGPLHWQLRELIARRAAGLKVTKADVDSCTGW